MTPPSRDKPLRLGTLAELGRLQRDMQQRARQRQALEQQRRESQRQRETAAQLFQQAVSDVQPLRQQATAAAPLPRAAPVPRQRLRDDQAVLDESLSDAFDAGTLLETDGELSYRRPGVGADVLRRLRRGEWSLQGQIDLHGLRREEARDALAEYLRHCVRRGWRCVRVVHGKGLNSQGGEPVLKGKVRHWLVQKDEVIAFCQAGPSDGGAGALLVLLRPTRP